MFFSLDIIYTRNKNINAESILKSLNEKKKLQQEDDNIH